jgi:hypothetical protein
VGVNVKDASIVLLFGIWHRLCAPYAIVGL